jgi:hypothetical protein
MAFKPAVRSQSKLRIAISGISGSGKTYTSIMLAKLLGVAKLAIIDSERGSSSKNARPDGKEEGPGMWDFDVCELGSNKKPQDYIVAISDAARAGYDGLIIDSYSHSWIAALEQVDAMGKIMGWKTVSPLVQKLVDSVYDYPGHVLCTFRSKQEHAVETDVQGKVCVRKLGMASVAREGTEYEFDMWFDFRQGGIIAVNKSRCTGISEGDIYQRSDLPFLIDTIKAWLSTGAAPAPRVVVDVPKDAKVSALDAAEARFKACTTYDALLAAGKEIQATVLTGASEADKARMRTVFSECKLALEAK